MCQNRRRRGSLRGQGETTQQKVKWSQENGGAEGQENRESREIQNVRPEGKEQNIEMVKGIIQEMVDDVPSGTEGTQVQVHRSGVGPVHESSQEGLKVQETMDEEDIPWCVVCYGEGSQGNPLGEVTWGDTPEDVPCWMCRRCQQRK